MLSLFQVENYCNANNGCKYHQIITRKDDGARVNVCVKKSNSLKKIVIDQWSDTLADNCDGYLYMEYAPQGNDIPGSI